MRVIKKQAKEENGVMENTKKPATEMPSSALNITKMRAMKILAGAIQNLRFKFPVRSAQMAHEKSRPTVEKMVILKRIYIIQQPRKC
uniref:Death-associated protein-like 1 n=1 Tax=Geotrypetes seraphini TaxID=260995 RepID=A0A6P8QP20_GEOSA|nr:death-associated protein-like 1 [Geotrypetes seraphini]XP_033800186.1 death-associated protein-like 1 [Geotrypetes seraphini]XP_033800187.1 death-associated protein-like 1 [Geotrypetes seraphini]